MKILLLAKWLIVLLATLTLAGCMIEGPDRGFGDRHGPEHDEHGNHDHDHDRDHDRDH